MNTLNINDNNVATRDDNRVVNEYTRAHTVAFPTLRSLERTSPTLRDRLIAICRVSAVALALSGATQASLADVDNGAVDVKVYAGQNCHGTNISYVGLGAARDRDDEQYAAAICPIIKDRPWATSEQDDDLGLIDIRVRLTDVGFRTVCLAESKAANSDLGAFVFSPSIGGGGDHFVYMHDLPTFSTGPVGLICFLTDNYDEGSEPAVDNYLVMEN